MDFWKTVFSNPVLSLQAGIYLGMAFGAFITLVIINGRNK